MNLKEILGEELYKQVASKLGDKKIDVVNNGQWIPVEKFNSLNIDLKEVKQQLSDRDLQLNELGEKAKDNDILTKEIEKLKQDNLNTIKDYEDKIKQREYDFALDGQLVKSKAKNIKALRALLDENIISLDDKGNLIGIEEQIKNIKASEPYLFEGDGVKGKTPNLGGKSGLSNNPFSKEHFNLTEQGKLLKSNPELAKEYMAQANK